MTIRPVARIAALLIAAAVGAALYAGLTPHQAAPSVLSAMDIGFAQDMSAHHQQAVTMTDMLAPDATPTVKALAEQIRFTQLTEIGQMTGWLQLADAPPSGSHPMAWMSGTDPGHPDGTPMSDMTSMPGMATPAELTRLQRSTGAANQTLFLQLMTHHHEGGIAMAAYAFQHSTNDAIRRAASIMVDEQTQELQLMAIMATQNATAH
jgi:uncharacterized protein (DUF305 family)